MEVTEVRALQEIHYGFLAVSLVKSVKDLFGIK